MSYIVFALILLMQYVIISSGSYYWRDYHNQIPSDAYSAGTDVNHELAYVGHVVLPNFQGIYPTHIYAGKDVYGPMWGPQKASFVEILCTTDPQKFEWILTNSTHLHVMQINNALVRGGLQAQDFVSIGRIRTNGGTVIGKVMSGWIGSANLWVVDSGREKMIGVFEVLTYKN